MLMTLMRRWNAWPVLVLAIAIAALPIIHQHPVIPGSDQQPSLAEALNLPCAVCATTHARITVDVPRLAAPLPAAQPLGAAPAAVETVRSAAPLASRAPPAA
jgi:hypothetical protein